MAISIIHTADIHFGMENYGHIDPKTGLHSRLLDFKKSLDYCIEYAIKNNVDCFIFAGDAYKNCHPSPTHQRLLLQSFEPLFKNKIPIVILIGNHDHSGNSLKAHALDVFYHLNHADCYIIDRPKNIIINTKNGPLQITGIPWPNRANILQNLNATTSDIAYLIADGLKKIIKNKASELDHSIPSILIGHLTIATGTFSGSERSPILGRDPILYVEDLAIKPYDYVALGHLHRYQNLNKNSYPSVVYSGSPDVIDFGEANDLKGFCIINIKEKNLTEHKFIETPARKFLEINLNISSYSSFEKEAQKEIEKINIDESIIKIKYSTNDNKIIETSRFHKLFNKAWYIADIKCTNKNIESKKERSINLQTNSIEDAILLYIKNNKEFNENFNYYKELIDFYVYNNQS